MHLAVVILTFLISAAFAQTPPQTAAAKSDLAASDQPKKAKVSGQVLSINGDPVRRANLALQPAGGGGAGSITSTSDAEGKFEFADINPGRYLLYAERQGFMRQAYGSRDGVRGATAIQISAGQELKDLSFKMTPHGVIAGRIIDEDGEGIGLGGAVAMRYGYVRGKKELQVVSAGNTNDQGEFRIPNLPPGRYYVVAVRVRVNQGTAAKPTGKPEEGYTMTFYPNATEIGAAAPLEVTPGAELRGMDIRLRKVRTVRVSGKILDVTGAPASNVALITVRRDLTNVPLNSGPIAQVSNGTFELSEVAPGPYHLLVVSTTGGGPLFTRFPLDVAEDNISGLIFSMNDGQDIEGSVKAPGSGPLTSTRVTLVPHDTLMINAPGSQVKEDGTFQFKRVSPEKYRLETAGLPEGFYLKSAQFGGQDVTDAPVEIAAGASGPLEIVLAPGAASVSGSVRDSKGDLVSGAIMTLVPKNPPKVRRDMYRTGFTDQSGNYILRGIPPGQYLLMAWEDVEPSSVEDPEVRKPVAKYAVEVKLEEKGSAQHTLSAIPREAKPK